MIHITFHKTCTLFACEFIRNAVLSLLEAPGEKTPPTALLFCAICASWGALILCCWHMEIYMSPQQKKPGCRGCHCYLKQHMSWLNYVSVYGFHQVLIRSAGRFYFVGALLFCDNLQTHLGAHLLGRALLIGTFRYLQILFGLLQLYHYSNGDYVTLTARLKTTSTK